MLKRFYETETEKSTYCPPFFLAAMESHVPNKGEQMVRYYGYYSNVSRGKRSKLNLDEVTLLP